MRTTTNISAWISHRRVIVLSGATVALLFVGPLIVYLLQSAEARRGWNWGTYPEWIGGIGTASAFGFAAFVYRNDTSARHEEERRSQARLVDAWVHGAAWDTSGDRWAMQILVKVSNGSAQAVRGFDVTIFFEPFGDEKTYMLHVIPPTAPGSETSSRLSSPEFDKDVMDRYPNYTLKALLKLGIHFTDASGNRWSRTPEGELRWLYNRADQARRGGVGAAAGE